MANNNAAEAPAAPKFGRGLSLRQIAERSPVQWLALNQAGHRLGVTNAVVGNKFCDCANDTGGRWEIRLTHFQMNDIPALTLKLVSSINDLHDFKRHDGLSPI